MTAARVLYAIARFALFLALMMIALGVAIRVLRTPASDYKRVTVDNRVDFPSDWATYPVVAKLRPEASKVVERSDAMFSGTDTSLGPLGDVVVRYKETFCTAGGSSCTGAPRTLFDVYVGDLDANGAPAIPTELDCTALPNFGYGPTTPQPACNATALTLRRSPDGKISVVTFVDPEPTEKPIAAFTRSTMPRFQAPVSRSRKWLYFFALAFLAGGAFAMFKSHRFFGARGILTWKEARVADNVVTCGEFSAPVPGLKHQSRPLLIDPVAITNATSYRDAPSLDRSAIFLGMRAEALTRAQITALLAAILFFASAGIAALCAAQVLF
jgi:hypothetical protein